MCTPTRLLLAVLLALSPGAAYAQGAPCPYAGATYADGALACQRGALWQCMNGAWVDQEQTCAGDYGGASGSLDMQTGAERPAPTDAFMPGDSQVAPPMSDDE
ncbi:MAG: hypothetical protein IT386_09440 [Deltaproteobacteria bacterium]|nr:hypothetical protein [Deltaproteobacteria bacterium]